MVVSLRKAFLFVVLVLALLGGLFGWTMKTMTTPMLQPHHVGIHTSQHYLAANPNYTCLPYPATC